MNAWRLMASSLWHYRRNAAAITIGVVTAAAVLAGALIVGDSVRASLQNMSRQRLGQVDFALVGSRFFREQLAADLQGNAEFAEQIRAVAPMIVLPCTAEQPTDDGRGVVSRAGKVTVYGIDDRAWSLINPQKPVDAAATTAATATVAKSATDPTATPAGSPTTVPAPAADSVILSARLAKQLSVQVGGSVILTLELPSAIPRDSLLGERDDVAVQLPAKCTHILPEESGAGRFGLQPDQQLPLIAFVELSGLQERLGLGRRPASRRNPKPREAKVNALLAAAKDPAAAETIRAESIAGLLGSAVTATWQLADLDLRLVTPKDSGYVALESERMLLEDELAAIARESATKLGLDTSPVLLYLANELNAGKGEKAFSMYSTVAGIEPRLFTDTSTAPFGPLNVTGTSAVSPLSVNTGSNDGVPPIILNDWLAADLEARVGDTVSMQYHQVGSHGELPTVEKSFRVTGIATLSDKRVADRGITPEVPGITDAKTFQEWEQPFPMQMNRITDRDEKYWSEYRAVPKAFIPLTVAQEIWKSRFGTLTSLRFSLIPTGDAAETRRRIEAEFRNRLLPENFGLSFKPVKFIGLQAASGTTDFAGLFIGFSFFLILSAAMLITLLFRLGVELRGSEIGLLLAVGWKSNRVRRMLMAEGIIVGLLGSAVGLLAAVGYAALMLHGLRTWWVGAIGTRFLFLHLEPATLVSGFVMTSVLSAAAVWWGLMNLRGTSIRGLLAGSLQSMQPTTIPHGRLSLITGLLLAAVAIGLSVSSAAGLIPNQEAFGGFSQPVIAFFVAGLAALIAGQLLLAAVLSADTGLAVRGQGMSGAIRLGLKSASRNRRRSVLTVGLVSLATFLIITVAAAQRDPVSERPDKSTGNGGFSLVAESSVPVLADLNTATGRNSLNLADEPAITALSKVAEIVPFRVNPGENASCLNIYKTQQPTILGVTREMLTRGGFHFADVRRDAPWSLLTDPADADGAIPVLGDMNTLMYSLHVAPGQTIMLRDEAGQPFKAKIAGMLDGSIFQGVLLMSEENFLQKFPGRSGFQYFLIDVPPENAQAVSDILESRIAGFDVEPVAVRLAAFLAVQNTYLSTFLALGGLGLLMGTAGLGAVMLRNVVERRSEFALLRAVGFTTQRIRLVVLSESTSLLIAGLCIGGIAAMLSMLPHLMSVGATPPWGNLAVLLTAVLTSGVLATFFAVNAAVNTPVVTTLRGE